jgi:hypothetical protein
MAGFLGIPLEHGSGYAPGIMAVTTADRSEQRLVWTLVAVLTVVLAYALAGAVGAAPTSVAHWTGVALLIGGIGLAAAGMLTARDERLRLEDQLIRARERPVTLDALRPQDVVVRHETAVLADPQAPRSAGGGIRVSITTVGILVGGGQRLQIWGVACLLLGTILTAFW